MYFVELGRDPDASISERVVDFDPDSTTKIELEHPGRRVVLERRESQWTMTEPVEALADQRNVANLLDAVAGAEISRTLDDIENLPRFGLDVPSATIRLFDKDQERTTLKLGKSTPVGGSVYVQRNDDTSVLLTSSSLVARIDQKAADLRDKTILSFDDRAVRSLTVRNPDGTVTIDKSGDGWMISAPAEFEADTGAVTGVLTALKSMRATNFIAETSDNLDRYGLDAPKRSVSIELENGETVELRVGNVRDGNVRLQTSLRPTIYAVGTWAVDSLDKRLEDFRDKTIAHFAAEDATRVEIRSSVGPPLVFEREGDRWTARHAPDRGQPSVDEDPGAIDDLLRTLASLRGFEIAGSAENASAFGLDPADLEVRATDAEGVDLAVVRLGSHTVAGAQTEYTSMRVGGATVFHIREVDYKVLSALRKKSLEGTASPVPDTKADNDVDENALDDTAAASE